MLSKKSIPFLILAFHVLALIGYHFFGNIGHYGYDDMQYAKIASNLTKGIADYTDHFTFRFPIVFFTAFAYSIFGVTDFASSLPSLAISIFTLVLLFLSLRNKGTTALIIGLSLCTFANWFIFYSDKLMPDIYVAFSVLSVLFILHRYKYEGHRGLVKSSILFALALLFGFMAKETIVLILPLLMYIFIVDLIKKRDLKFWIYSGVFGIILLAIYFIFLWKVTGNYGSRFDAILKNNYLNLCSYDHQSVKILLKRIAYEFIEMMTNSVMFTGVVLVVGGIITKGLRRYLLMNDSYSFYMISSVILVLSSNFMTISLTSYVPMCLDPRHYLFLIPVVAIPASIIVTEFIKTKAYAIGLIIVLSTISLWSFILSGQFFWIFYVPLTLLFLAYYFIPYGKGVRNIFILIFVIVLMAVPFQTIRYAQKIKYQKQKEIFYKYIVNPNEDCYVITNIVQQRLGEYYGEFKSKRYKLLIFNGFNPDTLKNKKKILFLNAYTESLSGLDYNDLPLYARKAKSSGLPLYENKNLNISIYELSQLTIPPINGTQLLYSLNDFETNVHSWVQNENDITSKIKFQGKSSILVKEYSSTFQCPMDSLLLNKEDEIEITCNVQCYFEDRTDAKLVISLETPDGNYIWHAIDVNKYVKAYSNWWPLKAAFSLKGNEIKGGSLLKIYIWNINKKEAYIDNFEVNIAKIEN